MLFTSAQMEQINIIKGYECPITCEVTLSPVRIIYSIKSDTVELEQSVCVFDSFALKSWIKKQQDSSTTATCPISRRPIRNTFSVVLPKIINEFLGAIAVGNSEFVRTWVNLDCPVNSHFATGNTPLYLAARSGHVEIVNMLIAAGGDIYQLQQGGLHNGVNAIYVAALHEDDAIFDALIANGSDINRFYQDGVIRGMSLLFVAARLGHIKALNYLLARGAVVNHFQLSGVNQGMSPLYIAAKLGQLGVVKALIARGAQINQTQIIGTAAWLSPLHAAVQFDKFEVANVLLANGAEITKVIEELKMSDKMKQLIEQAKEASISAVAVIDIKKTGGCSVLRSILFCFGCRREKAPTVTASASYQPPVMSVLRDRI